MLRRSLGSGRCCAIVLVRMLAGCAVLLGANGCDAGDAPLTAGPKLRLLAYEPQHNQGLTCNSAQDSCGFPRNRPLRFVFDRWLHPNTANRDSISVTFLGTDFYVRWDPVYDVVSRSVTFSPQWMSGYLFDLRLYDSKEDTWGFRSYDRQPLDHSRIPEHIVFRVGAPEPRTEEIPSRTTCRDALRAFASAGCAASNCHRASNDCSPGRCQTAPRGGLALDTVAGLSDSIGRLANVTDRAAQSGSTSLGEDRFGFNMSLIEAGNPALSFLLYRMLLGRDAYRNQQGEFVVQPPTPDELERARSWFGVTSEMPPPEVGWPQDTSPIELVRTVRNWIEDGASTSDCE